MGNIAFLPPPILPLSLSRSLSRPRHVTHSPPTLKSREFWVEPLTPPTLSTALHHGTQILFSDPSTTLPHPARSTILSPDGTFPQGIHRTVSTAADIPPLTAAAGAHDIVIVSCADWSRIPIENLLAAYQHSPTRLFAIVEDAASADAMFGMLEVGVDGCVLRTSEPGEVDKFAALRERVSGGETVDFTTAEVVSVRPVGRGERVCIDTCSLLRPDEGLLVGTSSQALFHVLSEAPPSSYVPSRPFRVNAGPVHSYCRLPGGRTAYLSELSAGDDVLLATPDGATRVATVGRAKIETRPLLLLSAAVDGVLRTVFLQNAETVRVAAGGEMKSVTDLQPGDEVLLVTDEYARHTGIAIKEMLVEK